MGANNLELRIRLNADGTLSGEVKKANEALRKLGASARHSGREMERGFSRARRGVESISRQLRDLQRLALGLGSLHILSGWARDFFAVAAEAQSLEQSLKAVTGSAEGAQEALSFVRKEADRLGLPVAEATRQFLALSAAARGTAIEGQQTREIFSALSEAAVVLGMSNENLEGAFTAVQQIMSKGVVSAEELRQQLGERLYGAFQTAARSIGVTTQELSQLLNRGLLPMERFLPAFARQLRSEFGGAVAESSRTAVRELNRLENAWRDMVIAAAEGGLLDAITASFRELTGVLKDPDVVAGARQIGHWIAQIVRLIAENADKLDNFAGAIAGMSVASKGARFVPHPVGKAAVVAAGGAIGYAAPDLFDDETPASGNAPTAETRRRALQRQIQNLERALALSRGRERERLQQALAAQKQRLADLDAAPAVSRKASSGSAGASSSSFDFKALLSGGKKPVKRIDTQSMLKADEVRRAWEALSDAIEKGRIDLGDYLLQANDLADQELALRERQLEKERTLERNHLAALERQRKQAQGQQAQQLDAQIQQSRNKLAKLRAEQVIAERDHAARLAEIAATAAAVDPAAGIKDQVLAAQERLQAVEQSVQARIRAGLISEARGRAEIARAAKAQANALKDLIPRVKELLAASNDPGEQAALETLLATITEIQARAQDRSWIDGAKAALRDYRNTAEDTFQQVREAVSRTLSSLEDRLVEFVRTGKFNFRSLVDSIVADLARIIIRKNITSPIAQVIDEIDWGDVFGSIFHGGGIVGSAAPRRALPALAFASAPRYHSGGIAGLAPDEVPAILQRGEEVITRSDPRHRANGGGAANITVQVVESPGNGGQVQRERGPDGRELIRVMVEQVRSALAGDIATGNGDLPAALERAYGLNRAAGAY